MYQTYILYSRSIDQYYTGHTGVGVDERLNRHNAGWTRSTKAGMPWKLKYYKSFTTKREAIQWERHIKKQKSRDYIKKLIHSNENELNH